MDDRLKGIEENVIVINNISYANDAVFLADNREDLQFMMERIVQYSEEHNYYINATKTELLAVAKTNIIANLTVYGRTLEQVKSLKYLGTSINGQCDLDIEILTRIEEAKRRSLL